MNRFSCRSAMIARNSADLSPFSEEKRTGLLYRLFALCSVTVLLLSPLRAVGGEIWLAPFNPLLVPIVQPGATSDYFALFSPAAPWDRSAAAIRVFKIGSGLVLNATDAQLQTIFVDLKRRHIALGLEIMALTARPDCGQKVEGYARAGDIARMMERMRRLGGDLEYVAMDGPLWSGHLSSLPNACRAPMSDIVADVANTVRTIKQVFPAAQIGDIEAIGRAEPPDLLDELMRWTKAYQVATGEPLAFVHFDTVWSGPWLQQFRQISPRLRAAGIKFGIIYNGDRPDQTDLAWTSHAEQRFSIIEADPALVPDHAVIQTWMMHPSRSLPETQAGTLTWLVNRYLTTETRLVLRRVGERLEGTITDTSGNPVPNVSIALSAAFTGTEGAPTLHTSSGVVPAKAATAVLALRINAECECSGLADVAIGAMEYREQGSGQSVQQTFRHPGAPLGAAARFHAESGQAITQNTQRFPVTANNPFTVQVPMSINPVSAGSGYVALIFLDAEGKGVLRLRLPFAPVEQSIGNAVADAQGRFSLKPSAEALRSSVGFRAEFRGDPQHRTAEASVP
jgi:hypothetical protein